MKNNQIKKNENLIFGIFLMISIFLGGVILYAILSHIISGVNILGDVTQFKSHKEEQPSKLSTFIYLKGDE